MAETQKASKYPRADLAEAAPSAMHQKFAEFLEKQTGVKVDPKAVQLVTTLRVPFRKSPLYLEEYKGSLEEQKAAEAQKREAAKAAKQKEREEARAKKDAERAEKAKEREAAKAAKTKEREEKKAKKEAEAKAKAEADAKEAAKGASVVKDTGDDNAEEPSDDKVAAAAGNSPF